jgi:hypothetical protein
MKRDERWVAEFSLGHKRWTLYQTAHGEFFLRHCDDGTIEPVSELEVRRLLAACLDRKEIEDTVDKITDAIRTKAPGFHLPSALREEIIRNTHRNARKAGLLRTGALPNLGKFFR